MQTMTDTFEITIQPAKRGYEILGYNTRSKEIRVLAIGKEYRDAHGEAIRVRGEWERFLNGA